MAKELPYFKFEPSEWSSGMIQLCSLEAKGLFIEICCLYWTRLGDLPYAFALQKLCMGNTSLLKELEKSGIYDMDNDNIVINFLDEQLNEFQETSEKRAKAANKRWSNASALQVHCKSNAIREEKRREDNKEPLSDKSLSPKASTKSKKEYTVGHKVRLTFEEKYLDITSNEYQWSAKEGAATKSLITKLQNSAKGKGVVLDDQKICDSVLWMIENSDDWIKDNLSIAILNSKFNEILNTKKNGTKRDFKELTRKIREENPNI